MHSPILTLLYFSCSYNIWPYWFILRSVFCSTQFTVGYFSKLGIWFNYIMSLLCRHFTKLFEAGLQKSLWLDGELLLLICGLFYFILANVICQNVINDGIYWSFITTSIYFLFASDLCSTSFCNLLHDTSFWFISCVGILCSVYQNCFLWISIRFYLIRVVLIVWER